MTQTPTPPSTSPTIGSSRLWRRLSTVERTRSVRRKDHSLVDTLFVERSTALERIVLKQTSSPLLLRTLPSLKALRLLSSPMGAVLAPVPSSVYGSPYFLLFHSSRSYRSPWQRLKAPKPLLSAARVTHPRNTAELSAGRVLTFPLLTVKLRCVRVWSSLLCLDDFAKRQPG